MRGSTIGVILLSSGLFGGHIVRANGPQFTGLLQDFTGGGSGDLRRNSLIATIDKDGAVGPTIPLQGERWSDVIAAPNGFYYALYDTVDAYRIDPATMVATPLPVTGVNVETDFKLGLTWDTARNRLVVGSFSGEGWLFGYSEASNQWNVIRSLNNLYLRSIAYRPSNDTLYGLQEQFGGGAINTIYRFDGSGLPTGHITLSQPIGDNTTWGPDWQMYFASDGELAAIGTEWVTTSSGIRTRIRSRLYLINPDTGVVNYNGVLPPPPQWNIDRDGSWNASGSWSTNTIPNASKAEANLLGIITAPTTISLDGNHTAGTLVFDNENQYTIAPGSGGTLNIGDASTPGIITVTTGNHEIAAPLAIASVSTVDINSGQSLNLSGSFAIAAGQSLTKVGRGTLRISGAAHHDAASLVVQQGTVELDSNQGTPNTAATSKLAVSVTGNSSGTPSTIVLNVDQDLAFLAINTADAGTQTFDLNSPADGQFNTVRVYAVDLNGVKTALAAAIRNANAAGAADPLDGIIDSGRQPGSAIGIAIIGDHVTIRPTRIGDLNLDGKVSVSDFIDLAANFNRTGKSWQDGDLNGDGKVSIADFIDLAANFGASYEGGFGPADAGDFQMLASFASSIGVNPSVIGSAVPEPAALGLLAVGALGLLKRRRDQAG